MRFVSTGRAGVSSIVGSIFFVLIMIVAMASLVTIFNSFTAYNQQVNARGSTAAQVADTQLSVTGDQFGGFPPSTTSNFNVATSCLTTSTSTTNSGHLFYAAGMWWDFYTCNGEFQYSDSFDGVNWQSEVAIPSVIYAGYTVGPYWDIDVAGSTIYLAIAEVGAAGFQLGIGTLTSGGSNSSPAGTITWSSAPATVETSAAVFTTPGPIQVDADNAGNVWVATIQGTCSSTTNCAIGVYERQACATGVSAADGWESNSCSAACTGACTNWAPSVLGNPTASLPENTNMIMLAPPSTLTASSTVPGTGIIILYETTTGSTTPSSTGPLAVVTQTNLASTTWNTGITLSSIQDYSLTSSSAVFISNTMYIAGLASASVGSTTGTLRFWTLPFTSMTAATNTADVSIESTTQAWMAALTSSGTTLALFDSYPTSVTVQYYTSGTLGSIWSSAIPLETSETAVNGLNPASGGIAVTWANTTPNVRFAALSTFTLSNQSPFAVHVVDAYVYNPATNLLVAHWYYNSSEDFDWWVGQGGTMVIPLRFVWTASTSYLITFSTDQGVTAQITPETLPITTTTCASGSFLSEVSPSSVCTNYVDHLGTSEALSTAAPTLVQNTFNTFTSGTSGTKAFTYPLAARDLVIVCEGQSALSDTPTTPSDTLGLTYTSITTDTTNSVRLACWKAMDNSGGTDTVTGNYAGTCSATDLCTLFIWEVSGSDSVLVVSSTRSSATTCTACTVTSISVTNTPLILAMYQHNTADTCTAGASFAVANGETGSLQYCTEKSTSITSAATTCPATIGGTAQVNAAICVIAIKATTPFVATLNANTNYVFEVHLDFAAPTGAAQVLYLHDMDTGVTLEAACMTGSQTLANNACYTATDTTLYNTAPTVAQSLIVWGTITVGSTSTLLQVEFGCTTSATTNAETLNAGSYITVTPSQ